VNPRIAGVLASRRSTPFAKGNRKGTRFHPGTKRVSRVEENTAADDIELSAQQIERLNNLAPATGERHEEGNMAVIDR
jgi:diketogulonate reductase-like aldo/keto reductase